MSELGMEYAKKWCVPQWETEASAYDFVTKLAPDLQRWEFLRRLPAYRSAWTVNGQSVGGFGLKKLIDPRIHCNELTNAQRRRLCSVQALPLGQALPPPSLDTLVGKIGSSPSQDIAREIGAGVLHLIESGYTLFVTDPYSAAHRQAIAIEKVLSRIQKQMREEDGPGQSRVNKPRVADLRILLRVMDACNQLSVSNNSRGDGALTHIGKTIYYEGKTNEASHWHKLVQRALEQAEKIALTPLPALAGVKLTK